MMLFANALVLGFKAMEELSIQLEEVIYPSELELKVDCCGFASISGVVGSITPTENSTTRDAIKPWAVLAKQRDFWKTKSRRTTSWAFFAHINPSSIEANSSSNLIEQFMCDIYYLVAPIVELKKGIITYNIENGFSAT